MANNISIPKKVINVYISFTLNPCLRNLNRYFTLNNCFFGSVKLTKNTDPDKCKYGSYGIEFDSRSESLFTDESIGKNVIIFGADMSSSVHVGNKNKYILILGEGPTQGLDIDNIEIMLGSETPEIIEELFKSPLQRYQEVLEE